MIRIALPLLALATVACVPHGRPGEAPAPPTAACNAEGLGDLIGKPRGEAVAAEAIRRSGAKLVRWITPGMMVTMDYRANRLNLHTSIENKVSDIRCG